jgi:hypothetical protein
LYVGRFFGTPPNRVVRRLSAPVRFVVTHRVCTELWEVRTEEALGRRS